MRLGILAAAFLIALSTAACAPRANPALRTRLDCPERQGDLVRASVAPDGKSCAYRAGDTQVDLQLTPVNGDVAATLSGVETALVGPQPATAADQATPASDKAGQAAAKAETKPTDAAAASSAAAKAAEEARADAGQASADKDWTAGDKHAVVIDKNGRHIAASDDGEGAHVDLPGIHISADNDNAQVDVAGVHIDAAEGQQTVHVFKDVRLAGQAFSRERNGVRATFIAHRDNLPGGYSVVGYEAGGPKTGPLTVATVRAHGDIDMHDRLSRDVRRLVRRNAGV